MSDHCCGNCFYYVEDLPASVEAPRVDTGQGECTFAVVHGLPAWARQRTDAMRYVNSCPAWSPQ